MSSGPQTLTRGNLSTTILLAVNLTPVAVAGNSTIEQNFNVPGTLSGDQISNFTFLGAFPNTDVSYVNARCPSANTITVAFQNGTGGSLTPPSGNYYIEINRLENTNLPAPSSFPT